MGIESPYSANDTICLPPRWFYLAPPISIPNPMMIERIPTPMKTTAAEKNRSFMDRVAAPGIKWLCLVPDACRVLIGR